MINVIMKFIASNPPSILFLGAILLLIMGEKDFAMILLVAGVFLQMAWLLLRR